jgi:serine/threonine protein kinase
MKKKYKFKEYVKRAIKCDIVGLENGNVAKVTLDSNYLPPPNPEKDKLSAPYKRFVREFKYLKKIKSHKHVIRLLDTKGLIHTDAISGIPNPELKRVGIILPFYEHSLKEFCFEGQKFEEWYWILFPVNVWNPQTAFVYLFKNLLLALKNIHASDIVHCDINPSNILFNICHGTSSSHPDFVISDFGNSVVRPKDKVNWRLTTTGYISPECLKIADPDTPPSTIPFKSDVFSLGVTMAQIKYGVYPFAFFVTETPQTVSIEKQQRLEYIERVKKTLPFPKNSYDELFEDLILKMVTCDIENRFSVDQCLSHPFFPSSRKRNRGSEESVVTPCKKKRKFFV